LRSSALAITLLAGAAASSHAQTVLDRNVLLGWAPPTSPPAIVTETASGSGTNAGAYTWNTQGTNPLGPMVFRPSGTIVEDGDAIADNVRMQFRPFTNTFGLARNGDIVVPFLTDGVFTLAGANNLSQANLTTRIELYREATAGAGDWALVGAQQFNTSVDGTVNAAGNVNINRTDVARFVNQPAGGRRFQVRATLDIGGNANGGVPGTPGVGGLNSSVSFDFRTAASNFGTAYSISAEPTAYNADSRAAVRAGAAEAAFGVTGAGVSVGIVEPGRALRTQVGYSARFTALNGVAGEADADEHATAVTGIIGADEGAGDQRSGVARGASLIGAALRDNGGGTISAATAVRNQIGAGLPGVINYSASDTGATPQSLDQFITANPNLTWVSAAGNNGVSNPGANNVPSPNQAYDNIAAGAMDSTFTRPADFSSTTAGAFPSKPDIMAPGEFILASSLRDINNDGTLRDYTRSFLGANYNHAVGADAGPVNGTSFAAPHVSGAVALMSSYAVAHPADYDAWSRDHRVMKAVLLDGASTAGITDRAGNAWSQPGKTGTGAQGGPAINVPRSLDPNLGAGMLDCYQATKVYASGEIRRAPQNALQNFKISGPTPNPNNFPDIVSTGRSSFWDYERVAQNDGTQNGTVDYILGANDNLHYIAETNTWAGLVTPNFTNLRSCLTWDATTNAGGTAYNPLSNLELRLYLDGLQDGNVNGFDPANPNADILIASTNNAAENVKLLDIADTSAWSYSVAFGSVPPTIWDPKFYLEVINLSNAGGPVDYGVAVMIPAPGAAGLLLTAGLLTLRRRRSGHSAEIAAR
jgi:hypothetical protein